VVSHHGVVGTATLPQARNTDSQVSKADSTARLPARTR
jgi:hypothetical protein